MLFPRCTHRRLCCMLLREFQTTRNFSRAFQIDPLTAQVKTSWEPSSSLPSWPKSNSRKPRRLRAGNEKSDRKEGFSDQNKLSTLLVLHNRRVRYPRSAEGAEGVGSRRARNQAVRNGRPFSPSASTEHEAHPGVSGDAAQSVPRDDRRNAPHLPDSLPHSRRVDGVIQPRVRGDPFLKDVLPPSPQSPIATLAHGLERVLFSPGVQWLQDPRSQVYNFTTWLEQIIPVTNFAFERLRPFEPSSRDEDLYAIAKRERRKYAGSTSSLSGLLQQLYYLISGDKPISTSNLSKPFSTQPQTFTPGQRGAVSVILHYRDGVYLIDSAGEDVPGLSTKNVLTWMGTLLEKFLTHPPREFLGLTRSVDNRRVAANELMREAYRYSKSDKFVLRSQLDCFDSRLPGTGVFDIKTRAVMSIRHDRLNLEESSGYEIRTLNGLVESFEKEYYDLVRSAFLKYSFQARIGNMDGVFVAYHNTKRIFGFQYIPLSEMDARLFGKRAAGNVVFEKCMLLLEAVLEEATRALPGQSIRLTAEKLEGGDELQVFLEPADLEELRGSTPVIQLDVSIKNHIGEQATDGSSAVERSRLPWTVLWSVSKSTLDPQIIRDNVYGARKRAFHKLFLPNGVTLLKMEKVWRKMQFNPAAPVHVPFKTRLFRPPTGGIKLLRRLARKGRMYRERHIREQMGIPKRVLGIPNDAEEVAKLVVLAHGPGLAHAVDNSNLSTGSRRFGDRQGPVWSSNVLASKNRRGTTRKAMTSLGLNPQANASGGEDFIPPRTLIHLEEMLAEDKSGVEDE